MSALTDSALKQLRTDTEYERLFLDHVLGSLPELWDWTIESQVPVTVAARTYRVDFSLASGPDQIAVEIDGEHKGQNAPSHDEWTRRQTALVSDGWEVLRFTNRQVRDEQEACRRELAVTVARLRERRRHVATVGVTAPALASIPAPEATQPSPTSRPHGGRRWTWAIAGLAVAVISVGSLIAANSGTPSSELPPPSEQTAARPPGGIDPVEMNNGFLLCPDSHPLMAAFTTK